MSDVQIYIVKKSAKKKRKIRWSIGLSILLVVLCYFADNEPLFSGIDLDWVRLTRIVYEEIHGDDADDYSPFYIDISYDMDTSTYYMNLDDESPCPMGVVAIPDRKKIYDVLCLLDSTNYKYIILDIAFGNNCKTKYDKELIDKINSMPRLIVANTRENKFKLRKDIDIEKSALASYRSTITATNLLRYEWMDSDCYRTIPLKIYEELNSGVEIKRIGWKVFGVYYSSEGLCNNSTVLDFSTKAFGEYRRSYNGMNEPNTYSMHDVLFCDSVITASIRLNSIKENADYKYVFIGDFRNDLHDTYAGMKPGCVVLNAAISSLEHKRHVVTGLLLVWGVIFLLTLLSILFNYNVSRKLPFLRKEKWRLIKYIIDCISYAVILTFFQMAEYFWMHQITNLLIPFFIFTVVRLVNDYLEHKKL